jgi:hypothetical protein
MQILFNPIEKNPHGEVRVWRLNHTSIVLDLFAYNTNAQVPFTVNVANGVLFLYFG